MSDKNIDIQKHESPVRRMVHDSHGLPYTALKSLNEARGTENAYLVMQGDEGGQIYLVAPANLVKCDEKILEILLKDLDDLAWNDMSMASIYYEVHAPDSTVSGGMGGGRTEKELWVHKDFENIKAKIAMVIDGLVESINR